MNEHATRRKLIFAVIAGVWALLEELAHQKILLTEIFLTAAFRVISILVFCFVVEEIYESRERAKREDRWERNYLKRNKGTIAAKLLRTYIEEARNGPSEVENRLVMQPAWLAKQSYETFWRIVTIWNESKKLTVLTIHTTEIEVWAQHPELNRLTAEFRSRGGKISRIICSRLEAPSATELEVAVQMARSGVEVWYYSRARFERTLASEFDFGWDFAFVKERRDACVWDSGRGGAAGDNKIERAEYFSGEVYRRQNLLNLWELLKANSVQITEDGVVHYERAANGQLSSPIGK